MKTGAVAQRSSFSACPLVVLAAAFSLGVLGAGISARPMLAPCVGVGVCLSVCSAAAFVKNKQRASVVLVVASFCCAGGAAVEVEEVRAGGARLRVLYERGQLVAGEPVELTGVLERAPEVAPDGLLLSVRVEMVRRGAKELVASGRAEFFAPRADARAAREFEGLELRRGARVRVMSVLARAERYRNPGVSSLGEYLAQRDADALATIKSPLLVERLDDERVFLPFVWLDAWRARMVALFDRSFTPDTSGVLKAALLGNRQGLSRRNAERFREGGTFHVLVISGLHITFLGGLVWAAARRVTRKALWRWALSVGCVWAYAVGVGAEASVVRAALMFSVAALAPALGRRSGALNALGGAALALLVWRPRNLFDPSFQLTFLSVLAIVALAAPLLLSLKEVGEWRPVRATPRPPVCAPWWLALGELLFWSERRHAKELGRATHSYRLFKTRWAARLERLRVQRLLRYVFAAVFVSLAVQYVLLPVQVLYFHRLSPASLVLNVFVGVLLVVLSASALLAVVLSTLSTTLAAPFVSLAEAASWLASHAVEPFAAAGVASIRPAEYSGAAAALYVVYYVPVLFLMFRAARRSPLAGAPANVDEGTAVRNLLGGAALFASVASALLIVLHPLSAGRPDGRLRVDILDVGQGDSALLTMPDGTTLLVDGGGRPRFGARGEGEAGVESFERDSRGVGEAVVSEYLWRRGLARVNFVLATHADADHIGGLNDVASNFRVDAALAARTPAGDEEFERFASTLRRGGVPLRTVQRGDVMRFGGGVLIDVLWPPRAPPGAASRNDDSLVLRVRFGRRTFLLAGDIERGAEAALVNSRDALRCDALKVAHHGSRTSSTEAFADAARPALAVISVGQDSPYGHPHPSVVERWRTLGAEVLTTGERGTITISTDGEDLRVETHVGKSREP